jgi:hypothetical protein
MTSTDSIKSLIDQSKDYLDTKIELTKLKAIDRSADVLSSVIVLISMFLISFMMVLFLSMGIALMVGKWLGSYHYGFFIVGGFYALVLLVMYLRRGKWIKTPIANGMINKMLK